MNSGSPVFSCLACSSVIMAASLVRLVADHPVEGGPRFPAVLTLVVRAAVRPVEIDVRRANVFAATERAPESARLYVFFIGHGDVHSCLTPLEREIVIPATVSDGVGHALLRVPDLDPTPVATLRE